MPLPLIDEDWRRPSEQPSRVRLCQFKLGGVIQPMDGRGPFKRRTRLANSFGSLDGDGRKVRQQFVKDVIDDPRLICLGPGAHSKHYTNTTV